MGRNFSQWLSQQLSPLAHCEEQDSPPQRAPGQQAEEGGQPRDNWKWTHSTREEGKWPPRRVCARDCGYTNGICEQALFFPKDYLCIFLRIGECLFIVSSCVS